MKVRLISLLFICSGFLYAQDIQKEIGKLYQEKRYNDVLVKTENILKEEQNDPFANLIEGRVLADQGLYSRGKPYIQKAIENDKDESWIKAWGLFYLGQIEFMSGKKVKAKELLEKCISMNSTKNATKAVTNFLIVSGLDDFYNNFEKIETEHFTFYFQPKSVVRDKLKYTDERESAFKEITSFFKVKLPKKIDFIIWNGDEDARKVGIEKLGFAGSEICCVQTRANQTVGHEMTHVISNYVSHNPIKTRFINEGTAVAFDIEKKSKLEIAKELKKKDSLDGQISIRDAWENPEKYPEWVYYPLAGEFIKRLIAKGGKEKFLKLVANQKYEDAKELYGGILDEVINGLEMEIN